MEQSGTPITREQIDLLLDLEVNECDIPQTMHETCAMTERILNIKAPPHIPPSLKLLLFLLENGITKVPVTQDEAIQLLEEVTIAHKRFASIIAVHGINWNSVDNRLIPAILRACYLRYGQPFPACWIDVVHWLATVATPQQRTIVPLCIAHVQHEARAVEIHALQLATDARFAQCLQKEYDTHAQVSSDAKFAQHLSRTRTFHFL